MKFKNFLMASLAAAAMMSSCSARQADTASDSSNAPSTEAKADSKSIVVYFSASGVTKAAAERLAGMLNAPVKEITPVQPYTDEDLDYENKESRSTKEKEDRTIRPEIKDSIDLTNYEYVFVGFPNWWNTYPNIIATFIESNDLKGKTIIPFMTSGGSTIENSEKELKAAYPELKFAPGLLMNKVSDEQIEEWIKPYK